MARLLLIRHGHPLAAWGDGDDPGLSEAGRAQAETAARALASAPIRALVSSPMRRCRETAAPFEAAYGLAARIEPRVSEVAAPAGAERRAWLASTFPWRGEGAATLWPDLDPALLRWRKDVIAAACEIEADTAVFTHFIAINALIGAALGDTRTVIARPALASITELACVGGALRLVRLGAQRQEGPVT